MYHEVSGSRLRILGTNHVVPEGMPLPAMTASMGGNNECRDFAVANVAWRRASLRLAPSKQASGKGLIPTDSYQTRSVKDAVPRVKAKEGDCLQREQLTSWFTSVRELPNPVISAYLQGLLLTGARREELAALRWEDVDFRWRSLTLNDKVEGTGGRTIPLTPYLSSLLLKLKRLNEVPATRRQIRRLEAQGRTWSPSPWVFPSPTSADGRLAKPRSAHTKALEQADLPHVTLHGLRRSFGTLSEWCEAPAGAIAQIQGHKPSAIAEKHYRRRPLDLLRKWHDQIEAWILTEAGVEFTARHAPQTPKDHEIHELHDTRAKEAGQL